MAFTKTLSDLKGKKYMRLTALEEVERHGKYVRQWKCKCDCGAVSIVRQSNLTSGNTKSCGCLDIEKGTERLRKRATHGRTYRPGRNIRTATYVSWQSMKSRCYASKTHGYTNYGGRGIAVCAEWRNSFENFLRDMGERPTGKTLDRKNVNEDYSADNCKWSDSKEQSLNKRPRRKKERKGSINVQ
jgi:hypothetical protein